MGTGAGALFLTTIVIRNYGTPESFETWSYLSTYLTLFFSFSVLGAEQLIIRYSSYSYPDNIKLSRGTICLFVIGAALFMLVFMQLLNGRLFSYRITTVNLVIILVSVSGLQAVYQFNRLIGAHTVGQVVFNLWRVVLLLTVSFMLLSERDYDLERAVAVILSGTLVVGFITSQRRYRFEVSTEYAGEIGVFFGMAIALFSMSLLGILDRIIIEQAAVYEGLNFQGYFYLITLAVSPFNMIASYVGYSSAKGFKVGLEKVVFLRKSVEIALVTSLAAALWVGVLVLLRRHLLVPEISVLTWILLVALVGARNAYAVLSAATLVRAPHHRLISSSLQSVAGLVLIGFVGVYAAAAVEEVLALYLLAWVLRYGVFWNSLRDEWTWVSGEARIKG
jgi:hypothetical protein